MANIDQFSVRVLALNSALRNVNRVSEEAKIALVELTSPKWKKGKKRTIRLFRTIQNILLDSEYLYASFDEKKEAEKLGSKLKLLQEQVIRFLAEYKRDFKNWQIDQVIEILNEVKALGDDVKKILLRLKKRSPAPGDYFYAGVDGGATKTEAVIANSNGKIIGEGVAGPCFAARYGFIKSFANVILAVKKATKVAGQEFNTTFFKRICIGVAGVDKNFDHNRLKSLFYKYSQREGKILNIGDAIVIQDSLLAWYSAFRGAPGIIAIGGTGFFVYGNNNGIDATNYMKGLKQIDFVGDTYPLLKIEGIDIAFHAARRIRILIAENKETILVRTMTAAYNNGLIFREFLNRNISFAEVLRLIEGTGHPQSSIIQSDEIANATIYVFQAARQGDKDAIEIIQVAANNSALYIAAVAEKIGFHNKVFRVALVGTTIRTFFARIKLQNALKELEPYAIITKVELEPCDGAIEIARKDFRFY